VIAASTSPLRHLVASLDSSEPAMPGLLVIEEGPLEPVRCRRAPLPSMVQVHRLDLSALARRRGLGEYLAAAAGRRM
jgi:hypothetical protein